MDESIDDLDVVVEGPDTAPKALFPLVGRDRTPTPEMIAEGRVGNGAWDLTTDDVQIARFEQHQKTIAERDERRKHFNEASKDALSDAVDFHHRIVKKGLEVLTRIEDPVEDKPVTAKEMDVLKMAFKSSKELADRGMGRAKAAETENESSSILQFFIKAD